MAYHLMSPAQANCWENLFGPTAKAEIEQSLHEEFLASLREVFLPTNGTWSIYTPGPIPTEGAPWPAH